MSIRKSTDYSTMYAALDSLMAAELPQMELYCEIGKLVSGRPEKGAAVAAADYLQKSYPDAAGFSPRNLRRMREFYKLYGDDANMIDLAMQAGWTQNIVIMEAELKMDGRAWYLKASARFGWSKSELINQISSSAHLVLSLDTQKTDTDKPEENGSEKPFVSVFKKSKNYCKPLMLSGFRRLYLRFFNRLHAWSVLQSLQYQ